jgi:2,5-diketo-D-gluconate reductase B
MPDTDLAQTLTAMMRLQEEGYARAIGVCNFNVALLRQAVDVIGAPIPCNQLEYHVLLDQSAVLRYARSKDITVIAYAPLARGRFLALPEMQRIARKHSASPAQVGLKWLLDQEGVAAIPRAGRRESQQENLDALRLTLDDDDRATAEESARRQCRLGTGMGSASAAQLMVANSSAALMTGGPFAKRRRRRLAET